MEPAHEGLHWHPADLAEREALFERIDAFLAARARARQLPLIPDEPVRTAEACPDCGNPTLWQGTRSLWNGTLWCPNCGWQEVPF